MERLERRHKQILDDLKETKGSSTSGEEALDRNVWRTRFWRGYGTVVRQTADGMNDEWELFTCIRPFLEIAEKYMLEFFSYECPFWSLVLTVRTTKFNIQKFLEICEAVEVNLHPFITTMLDSIWRCGSGEDVVAWPSQTPHPRSDKKVDGYRNLLGHRTE